MKKYFFLLLLSFVLVSCGKQESKPITTNKVPKNTQQEVSENKNNVVIENDSISNTWEIIETWSGESIEDSLVNMEVKENLQSTQSDEILDKKTSIADNWKIYQNSTLWLKINYPQEWVYEDSNDGISFGTPESKPGWYIWWIFINQPNKLEKLIAQQWSQFEDRKESRSEVVVNKNITGTMVTVTTNEYDDWISKYIYFENDGKLFWISNWAIDDDKFEIFYKSLEFSN